MDLSKYYNDMAELPIKNIKDLVIHHAAIPLQNNSDIEDIHRIHQGNGWLCVGYHVFIKKDGTIQYGRPIDSEGAQAYGHNHEGLGVCLAGYFHAPTNDNPTEVQIKSLISVLKNWKSKIPQKVRIIGHRDYGGTACPGDFLYSRLEEIKKATETGSSSPDVPAEKPTNIPTAIDEKTKVKETLKKYCKEYGLNYIDILAQAICESNLDPGAVSSSRALGVGQIKLATAEYICKRHGLVAPKKEEELFDVDLNCKLMCLIMSDMLKKAKEKHLYDTARLLYHDGEFSLEQGVNNPAGIEYNNKVVKKKKEIEKYLS